MLRRLITVSVFSFCIALLVTSTNAQVMDQPYRVNDKEVERIIRRIERQSDSFRSDIDSALDKSRFNGSGREDNLNAFFKEFYEQTKRLREHFDKHHSAEADVEAVLERAERIDDFMARNRLSSKAQNDWTSLRNGLDELALAFSVSWKWNSYGGDREPRVTEPIGTSVSGIPYRVSDREVEGILRAIEHQSDQFRSALDSSLDKSRLDGTRQEDDINRFVKDYYEETKKLRDHFDHHKSTTSDVQSVLDRAASIDSFMRRNRFRSDKAAREWSQLRSNLDQLAQAYNVEWQWRS